MTNTPKNRETVERLAQVSEEVTLYGDDWAPADDPLHHESVARALRALLDERDAAVARAESAMMDGYDLAKEEYRDRIAELEAEIEQLREADQIVWDLMANEHRDKGDKIIKVREVKE